MRIVWGTVLGLVLVAAVPAQAPVSDDVRLDAILSGPGLNWGQAAWLVGRTVGTFDEAVTPEAAIDQAEGLGWAPAGQGSTTPIDLQGYCFLLARAEGIPGGLFYTLIPGPRYAFRELVYRKIIPGTLAPDSSVTGTVALLYLQNIQTWKESHR